MNKITCLNRKARHDYFIEEALEAGIALVGTEVKSLREGRANLKDSYATVKDGEVFLLGCHISPFTQGNRFNHDPLRPRKLLLKKREIKKLTGKIKQRGYTLVPLKIYFKGKHAKVELGLGKGKRLFDKRAALKEADDKREIARALKNHRH
jgi:SsrA-binding protein